MASPTRRIYITDAEADAIQRMVTAAEFGNVPAPTDVTVARKVLAKLDLAGRAQPNRTT